MRKQMQKFRWGVKTVFTGFIAKKNHLGLNRMYDIKVPNYVTMGV